MTLERCKTILNPLGWNECKQIPSTVSIARRVRAFCLCGLWPKKRPYFLSNCTQSADWI
nr:MAG TPA: hypothetical protein [Caudoviricetes sp.]DAX77149.1 MAG TPA: hypothetical protein [Caudoviricetes sp.]